MKNVKAKLFPSKVRKLYHEKSVGKICHQKKIKVFSIRKSESVFIRKSESVFIRLGISGSSLAPPICKRENCDWIFIKTKKDTFQIQ